MSLRAFFKSMRHKEMMRFTGGSAFNEDLKANC